MLRVTSVNWAVEEERAAALDQGKRRKQERRSQRAVSATDSVQAAADWGGGLG
jgi:hypothetical protein